MSSPEAMLGAHACDMTRVVGGRSLHEACDYVRDLVKSSAE